MTKKWEFPFRRRHCNFSCFFPLISSFFRSRFFILALFALIIAATCYESALIAKGFNLDDGKDNGCKKTDSNKHLKPCENNNNNNDDDNNNNGNNNNNSDDKYEMNHINNKGMNNNDISEMNKTHMKSDLHKLGKSNCECVKNNCSDGSWGC